MIKTTPKTKEHLMICRFTPTPYKIGERYSWEGIAISGEDICQLMRQCGKTIRGLAREFNLTQKQVRRVRSNGAEGFNAANWIQNITGAAI